MELLIGGYYNEKNYFHYISVKSKTNYDMKKLFTFLFTSLMLNTFAADLYVFPSASSPNYSSINDAINAASDGDRILVAQSTYVENVEIPAKI